MTRWKKIGSWILGVIMIFLLFIVWYKHTFSMKATKHFEINRPTAKNRILIAMQGSEFKDSLVNDVITELKSKSVYISVIDVSDLSEVKEESWSAIIVIHTWENWKPQEDARLFIEKVKDKDKLIVLSTSGQGSYKIEGVDGITSASKLNEVSNKSKEITERLTKLIIVSDN
jgi:hypothetical protein